MKKVVLVAIVTFLAVSRAHGKCPFEEIVIKGNVNSDKGPVVGATVSVSYVVWKDERVTIQSFSGNRGAYEISFYFDTYSGTILFSGDKCDLKLDKAEIVLSASGFESTLDTALIQGRTTTYNKSLQPTASGG